MSVLQLALVLLLEYDVSIQSSGLFRVSTCGYRGLDVGRRHARLLGAMLPWASPSWPTAADMAINTPCLGFLTLPARLIDNEGTQSCILQKRIEVHGSFLAWETNAVFNERLRLCVLRSCEHS